MKKTVMLWCVVLVFTLLFGCGGGGGGGSKSTSSTISVTAADLTGTWKQLSSGSMDLSPYNVLTVFDSSSYTFTMPYINSDYPACSETGTWSVSGNTINFSPSAGSTCADTSPYSVTITAFTGTTMTVDNRGETETHEKLSTSTGSAPAAPTGVTATAGNGTVTLSWTSVSGATDYYIYVSETSGVSKTTYGQKLTDNTSPQGLTGFTNGTTYYFIVTAVNANGESAASAQVSATPTSGGSSTNSVPSAPTGVYATAGNGKVTVGWSSVTGATSYNIYYGGSTGVSKSNYQIELTNVTSPKDIPLPNGSTVYFVVTAVNANGESAASAQVSAKPALPAPTGVAAVSGTGTITLSWDSVSGASSYNVYYSTSSGVTKSNGTQISNATSPATYTGTELVTYHFVVTAVDAHSESADSAEVCATVGDGIHYIIPCN